MSIMEGRDVSDRMLIYIGNGKTIPCRCARDVSFVCLANGGRHLTDIGWDPMLMV